MRLPWISHWLFQYARFSKQWFLFVHLVTCTSTVQVYVAKTMFASMFFPVEWQNYNCVQLNIAAPHLDKLDSCSTDLILCSLSEGKVLPYVNLQELLFYCHSDGRWMFSKTYLGCCNDYCKFKINNKMCVCWVAWRRCLWKWIPGKLYVISEIFYKGLIWLCLK